MQQRSSEWFEIRKGKMTASHASEVAANGAGLRTYILKLMSEYYSSAETEQITNKDIERGIELEPQARMAFEFATGLEVEEEGFCEYNEYVGCSPDGLIGGDRLIEIKCPSDKVYLELLMSEKVDPKYYAQMQFQMLVTRRTSCFYVAYNPNFEKDLFIKEIERDEVMIGKIKDGIEAGITMIKEIKEKIENGKN